MVARYSDYGVWNYAVKTSNYGGFEWQDLFNDWEFVGSVCTWRQPGDSGYLDGYVGVKTVTVMFNTQGRAFEPLLFCTFLSISVLCCPVL